MAKEYMSMRNLRFQLHEVLNIEQLTKFNKYSEHTKDGFDMMLDSARQISDNLLFPIYTEMDEKKPEMVDGVVHVHPDIKKIIKEVGESGWIVAQEDFEHGGQQMPSSLYSAANFIFHSANTSADAEGDDGDGNDDENGSSISDTTPTQGQTITLTIMTGVDLANVPASFACFIDWNQDDDWHDAGETVVAATPKPSASQEAASASSGSAAVATAPVGPRPAPQQGAAASSSGAAPTATEKLNKLNAMHVSITVYVCVYIYLYIYIHIWFIYSFAAQWRTKT